MSVVTDARGMITGDPFSETITYTPNVGSPRTIPAIVDRNPPETDFLGEGSVPVRRFVIWVIRSATDGIDDPAIGLDQVDVKVKKTDGSPETFRIVTDLSPNDDGAMRLEVVQ